MISYHGIDYTQILTDGYCLASFENHSMGYSLKRYIEIKLSSIIFDESIDAIYVVGNFDRSKGISPKEKTDKILIIKGPQFLLKIMWLFLVVIQELIMYIIMQV